MSEGSAATTELVLDIEPGRARVGSQGVHDRPAPASSSRRTDPRGRSCGRRRSAAPCWSRTSTPAPVGRSPSELTDVGGTLFFGAFTARLRERALALAGLRGRYRDRGRNGPRERQRLSVAASATAVRSAAASCSPAETAAAGRELFTSTGATGSFQLVSNFAAGAASSVPRHPARQRLRRLRLGAHQCRRARTVDVGRHRSDVHRSLARAISIRG